jgi:hypothetical protein
MGMDKDTAKIVAQVAVTVAIIAASIAAGSIGNAASTASQAVKEITDVIQPILKMVTAYTGVVALASSGVGAYDTYQSGMSQADLKEAEKFIALLRQKLEESQEELQQILELIQNCIGQLADLLSSSTDTSEEIASKMGQMA